MTDDDNPAGKLDELPFARSYDFFKHMAGITLIANGGVFAFVDGGRVQFKPAQVLLLVALLGVSVMTSLLMTVSLAQAETEAHDRAGLAKKVRMAQHIIIWSLCIALGAFSYAFLTAILR